MGEQPTGNARAMSFRHPPIVRMTNTYIGNGNGSFADLIGDIKLGVYACSAFGGQTMLENFSFTAAYGHMIRDGQVAELVKDVVIAGNLFQTLDRIDRIAGDFQWNQMGGGCGKEGSFRLLSPKAPRTCGSRRRSSAATSAPAIEHHSIWCAAPAPAVPTACGDARNASIAFNWRPRRRNHRGSWDQLRVGERRPSRTAGLPRWTPRLPSWSPAPWPPPSWASRSLGLSAYAVAAGPHVAWSAPPGHPRRTDSHRREVVERLTREGCQVNVTLSGRSPPPAGQHRGRQRGVPLDRGRHQCGGMAHRGERRLGDRRRIEGGDLPTSRDIDALIQSIQSRPEWP
jgi:hypothetical protein